MLSLLRQERDRERENRNGVEGKEEGKGGERGKERGNSAMVVGGRRPCSLQ